MTLDERQEFFCTAIAHLNSICDDEEQFHDLCHAIDLHMQNHHAAANELILSSNADTLDQEETKQFQGLNYPFMESATIYRTKGDGSCFFNALSMLVFGDEAHSVEMRVRLILFMVLNAHNFSPNLEQQIAETSLLERSSLWLKSVCSCDHDGMNFDAQWSFDTEKFQRTEVGKMTCIEPSSLQRIILHEARRLTLSRSWACSNLFVPAAHCLGCTIVIFHKQASFNPEIWGIRA